MRRVPHVLLGIAAAAIVVLAIVAKPTYRILLQEDGPVEWTTFVAFLIGAAVGVRLLLKSQTRLAKFAALGLTLFCIFVAGEEISWGHRLFAFKPPKVFLEHNYQQELNVHNLLKNILDTRWMVMIIALCYGVIAPIIVRLKRWPWLQTLSPSLVWSPWFALVAGLELLYPFELTGEFAEMMLGLAMLCDLAMRAAAVGALRANVLSILLVVCVALGFAITPLMQRLLYGDEADNEALARAELALLVRDLQHPKNVRRKLTKKRRVHKRMYTAVRSRYFRFKSRSDFLEHQRTPAEKGASPAREDRRGYFLDPWSQPYWVLYNRDRPLIVYSFGANRRRDFDARARNTREVGDDLVFVVPTSTATGPAGKGR